MTATTSDAYPSPESALAHLVCHGRTARQAADLLETTERTLRRWRASSHGMPSDVLTERCRRLGVLLLYTPGEGWAAWFVDGAPGGLDAPETIADATT